MNLGSKGFNFSGDPVVKRENEPMWGAVPAQVQFPAHGIFSPYEALRLVLLIVYQHIDDALAQVESYAVAQQEFPYTPALPSFRGYFLAPRPLIDISEKEFPALFATLGEYASTTKSITGSGKAATNAKFTITLTIALKEKDTDIQVVKVCRYLAAIEYLIADIFLSPKYQLAPAKSPFQYLDTDLESFQWAITTATDIQPGLSATVGSFSFDIRKRVM